MTAGRAVFAAPDLPEGGPHRPRTSRAADRPAGDAGDTGRVIPDSADRDVPPRTAVTEHPASRGCGGEQGVGHRGAGVEDRTAGPVGGDQTGVT
ncbi:hypothetical protein SAMN05216275_13245 [Streptosporangium canum]|uniref:Uncharacterized protein n=1 Tax=Streptosporangium canum TaxID=324952 RepID=A0A1I4BM98_9ACTN|nr:hypothetical protein SAMN05216275_13245 [Streptosporangium canum]